MGLAKRTIDLVVAGLALLVLSPVIAITAVVVAVLLGRPIFFRQVRPGCGGRPFELVKFRTMSNRRDRDGKLLPDAERMTRLGAFLRSSSLDELPQLWNVLRGHMSLVGPRPLLMQYLPLYSKRQARRHEVRPGITGWAQVNGRNAIRWEDKLEMDVWYVEHQSLRLDAKILLLTLRKVVRRDGISQHGHVTTDPFRGSAEAQELVDLA